MEELELDLSMKSAEALRDFAEAMPLAIMNIAQSTERVAQVYQSVAEEVGPHSQDFYDMIALVRAAQEKVVEAIEALPPRMRYVADQIEEFVASHRSIEGN